MARRTKIEWADATWNPVRGCTRISAGCKYCYAERMAARGLPGLLSPTTGDPFSVMHAGEPRWTGNVELIEAELWRPLRWRNPRRVFVNSVSDTFHENVTGEQLGRMFAVMARCAQHTFLVLTKRSRRMMDWFAETSVPPNVWCGVSVEDQRRADERIPDLLNIAATVRYVSAEPLLGPLDLAPYMVPARVRLGYREVLERHPCDHARIPAHLRLRPHIHWVIVGGESGPGARPCQIGWVHGVVRQCDDAGTPCFVKQLGANRHWHWCHREDLPMIRHPKGGDAREWPEELRVRQWPDTAPDTVRAGTEGRNSR
jgi:protein gp37